jgi:protein-S-isoprenylcysteine O-methyltransferase Ste14
VSNWASVAKRIRVSLGFAFAILYLWLAHPSAWSLASGIAVAALGLMIRAVASGHVRKNETLTTSGPYAYVRNPLYLGSVITAAGFTIAARSGWIALAMVLIFVLIYLPVIRAEESFLRQRFAEFGQYAEHVPRLLPRRSPFGKFRGSFSWELYWKHREYNAFLGAALMIAALAVKMLWFTN